MRIRHALADGMMPFSGVGAAQALNTVPLLIEALLLVLWRRVKFAAWLKVVSTALIVGSASASDAADIQFDEPFEGHTRACVADACVESSTSAVARSITGSISGSDVLAELPSQFLPFANLLDLQNYQTEQTLRLDVVDGEGNVVNSLVADFSIAQLQFTGSFLFRSDAEGALINGAAVDVLTSSGYQDITQALQSQLDLSGLPYPFGAVAAFFQPAFFPISVSMRSGPLDVDGPTNSVSEPSLPLLFFAGLVACKLAVRRRWKATLPRALAPGLAPSAIPFTDINEN
jgi:hypothetical protein